MDDGRWPGRRDDGLVVPTVMAALLGGLGVLAVALAGSRGFTEALSAGGSPAVPTPVATVAKATALPNTASAPPVEASTAPPPIQVTP